MSEYTPTTQQVEDGFAHEPEYEYHNPVGYGAHVASNRRAFKRWLAEYTAGRERAAAEKAWDEGWGNCWLHHTSEGMQGRRENPYRADEMEGEQG